MPRMRSYLVGILGLWMGLSYGLVAAPALLDRADTMRMQGRVVQALSLYRTLLSEPLSGCDLARTHLGMGHIQWNAGNLSEAKQELLLAMRTCATCPAHRRTPLSLELAQLLVACGRTADALRTLTKEQELGPMAALVPKMELSLAELHFVQGHWQDTWDATTLQKGVRARGLRLQAGAMLGHPLADLAIDAYVREVRPSERDQALGELTHLHTLLTSTNRMQEALSLAKKMVQLCDPIADAERWTLGQLRVAVSAERAQKPLEALLAFHEASRTAHQLEDLSLRARIAREQARFEMERGAQGAAYGHLALADSLTLALLQTAKTSGDSKGFSSYPVMSDDPFELAAAKAMQPSPSPGPWPFACALILLGLLATSLRSNQLKQALRKERVRALRMQRMAAGEPMGDLGKEVELSGYGIGEQGGVEEVLTRPNRLDFDDIIASLETDHGTAIEWEFEGNSEGSTAPEGLLSLLSATVRKLLPQSPSDAPLTGTIRNDWHGIHVQIEGPETPSTLELQRMFAGGVHSSTWNPVLVQIEKLAGKFTVEKKVTGELALTFLLPHQQV